MHLKGHHPLEPRSSSRNAVLITTVLLSSVFAVVLYLQALVHGTCHEPVGVQNIDELQAYLARFSSNKGHLEENQHIQRVHGSLQAVMRNSSLLAWENTALQEKLTKRQEDLAAATAQAKKLEGQVAELTIVSDRVKTLEGKVEQQSKDLSGAQQQVQQLAQQKEQLEKEKLQQKPATASDGAGATASSGGPPSNSSLVAAKLQALATAGEQCTLLRDTELWHEPILIWGYDHRAADAAECCAACHSHARVVSRGGTEKGQNSSFACNTWSGCFNKEKCKERFGECWLRHQSKLPDPPAVPPQAHTVPGWVSGAVYENHAQLAPYNNTALVLHTKLGDIELQFLPELAPASVREVRRMAALLAPSGYCSNCRIYRPEKNFLVQGVMEHPGAYVATPRHPNPPQKMVLEPGLVCWAGGGGGPHWFVNVVANSHFKDQHLCFAKAKSMSVFEKILELPLKEKKNPSDMNALVEDVKYTMTLKQLQAGTAAGTQAHPAGEQTAAAVAATGTQESSTDTDY